MWADFFAAGGWGMYPTSFFGFLLIAASALYALRPDQRMARLVVTLGIVTFAAGLLGTSVGLGNTFHYIPQVAKDEQLQILALGCAESLHNAILGLMLVIVGGLVSSVGTLRRSDRTTTIAAAA